MPFLVDTDRGIAVPRAGGGGLGHNFETAPDGNEYFTVLGPSINLVISIRNILEAQRTYLSYPRGRGRDQAAALGVIARELETAVHASGVTAAQFAEERAKRLLDARIVRPRTPNPVHLRDLIVARSIGGPSGWGAVGIGDIAMLDQAPYWKAQEFGSEHLIGKELRGYFFHPGGPSRAGAEPPRSQAIFGVSKKGPKMLVRNPIEGKAFLTEASFDTLAMRYRIWRSVEDAAVAQVRTVRLATAGDLAGRRYSRTVGGFAALARQLPRVP